ncbi:MAG: hypothetical protein ACREEM_21695 [Blastocatellia bacterium]
MEEERLRATPTVQSFAGNLLSHATRHKAAMAIPLVVVIGLVLFKPRVLNQVNSRSAPLFQKIESVAITRTGNATCVAISPDSQYIAYGTDSDGLWLRNLVANSSQQIVPPVNAEYYGLSFSHDGRYLYFVWAENHNPLRALYRIPILGGTPSLLLRDIDWVPGFSPDNTRIVFHRLSLSASESYLMIANADGSGEYRLATRPLSERFRFHAWSPDGNVILCAAGSGDISGANQSLIEVRVADGVERRVSGQRWRGIGFPCWLSDGSGFLMTASDQAGSAGLWHISLPDGEARKITNDPDNYGSLSMTADAATVVTVKVRLQTNIWTAPVTRFQTEAIAEQTSTGIGSSKQLTTGFGDYHYVAWMPDGRILFTASAENIVKWDLWAMNADGTGRKQLTADASNHWEFTVSPDGRYVVFTSDRAGRMNIWRMNHDGGNPQQLTSGGGEQSPACSSDGKWAIYTSVDDWSLRKVSIDGGEPVRVTQGQSRGAAISHDGSWIAYSSREPQPGGVHRYRIVVIPFAGGPPPRTFDFPPCDSHELLLRWTPDSQAVAYIIERGGVSNIWRQPIAGGPPTPLTDFKSEQIFDFGWSRDGTQMICTRGLWAKDAFLVKSIK